MYVSGRYMRGKEEAGGRSVPSSYVRPGDGEFWLKKLRSLLREV